MWVVALKGLGHTWSDVAATILGTSDAGPGRISVARPGEKGVSVNEAVLCGTNALSAEVRTIDWSSGQVEWEALATTEPVLSIR